MQLDPSVEILLQNVCKNHHFGSSLMHFMVHRLTISTLEEGVDQQYGV
jgi:hypothetical protein